MGNYHTLLYIYMVFQNPDSTPIQSHSMLSATLKLANLFPVVTLEAIPPPDYSGDLIVLEQFKLITNLWAKQAPEAGLKTAVGKAHCVSKTTASNHRIPTGPT